MRRPTRQRKARPNRDVALDYALATGLSLWGVIMGVLGIFGHSPSRTISALPYWESLGWAIAIVLASASVLAGLFILRSLLAVSRGLFLLAATITIYWVSIISVSGWDNGGAVATFLLVISVVLVREGYALRQRAIPRSGGTGGTERR